MIAASDFFAGLPEPHRAALEAMAQTAWAGTLEVQLRELIRIRSAQLNGCRYCATARTEQAVSAGLTENRVCRLLDPADPAFSTRERIALEFVERFSRNDSSADDEEIRLRLAARIEGPQVIARILLHLSARRRRCSPVCFELDTEGRFRWRMKRRASAGACPASAHG